jgi:predicted flap endonuclease-1-like 5' DNA nuclease
VADEVLRPGHVDDLTVIRGIGPRTADDLASVGVTRFADLAAADAGDLARRLNGSSVAQVKKWIVQAQDLTAEES